MKNIVTLLLVFNFLSCSSQNDEIKFPKKLYPIKVNEKYGYINIKGEKVIDTQYDNTWEFNDSFAIVEINKKQGLINLNLNGEFMINPTFTTIDHNKEGYFALKIANNLYDFKRINGKSHIISAEIIGIHAFNDSLFHVTSVENSYINQYLVNGKGEKVTKNYATLKSTGSLIEFSTKKQNAKHLVFNDGILYGLMDYNEKIILDCKYTSISEFQEGLMSVSLDGLYGFLDSSFNTKIAHKFNYASDFSEGLAFCSISASPTEEKFGYIDKQGNAAIPFNFDDASNFKNGLARVGIGQNIGGQSISMSPNVEEHNFISFGFINKKGKFIIPPIYKIINSNEGTPIYPENNDGMIVLQRNKKFGAFDTLGKQLIPFEYDFIGKFDGGTAKFELNNEKGLINKKGEKLFSIRAAQVFIGEFDENGIAQIEIDDKIRYINKKGKFIW